MPLEIIAIVMAVFVLLLFTLVLKILKKPIKLVLKLLINALSGFITLWFVNLIGGLFGLELTISWVSAIVAGVLGLPGVVLIILYQYLF